MIVGAIDVVFSGCPKDAGAHLPRRDTAGSGCRGPRGRRRRRSAIFPGCRRRRCCCCWTMPSTSGCGVVRHGVVEDRVVDAPGDTPRRGLTDSACAIRCRIRVPGGRAGRAGRRLGMKFAGCCVWGLSHIITASSSRSRANSTLPETGGAVCSGRIDVLDERPVVDPGPDRWGPLVTCRSWTGRCRLLRRAARGSAVRLLDHSGRSVDSCSPGHAAGAGRAFGAGLHIPRWSDRQRFGSFSAVETVLQSFHRRRSPGC